MKQTDRKPSARKGAEGPAFRLVVHIGAGKTGTSSIQQTLRFGKEALRRAGTMYLGLMLEQSVEQKFDWQTPRAIEAFHRMNPEDTKAQVLELLVPAIARAMKEGYRQAIWSNESFLGQPRTVIPALGELAARGIDVGIVAYVRRHDAWARSAYLQWALKHKTSVGPLPSFGQYVAQRPVGFARQLAPWMESFDGKVTVRNMDAVGDVLEDFLKLTGIEAVGLERLRSNETPSGEELTLRGLFNEQFSQKVRPEEFDEAIDHKVLVYDRPIDEWLERMMPDEGMLRAVIDGCAEDREMLDLWLKAGGQPPIETSPLPFRRASVSAAKVMTAVAQIVMQQTVRIRALESKMKDEPAKQSPTPSASAVEVLNPAAARPPSDGAPVFVISAGGPAASLVQRLLNCHKRLVIWGANHGLLNGIADSYVRMANPDNPDFPKKAGDNRGPAMLLPTLADPKADIAWANPWSFEEFKNLFRQFIEGYFASRLEEGQRWGFSDPGYDKPQTLRMLRNLYPNGRFIFVTRDVEELASGSLSDSVKDPAWAGKPEREKADLARNAFVKVREGQRTQRKFIERHAESCLTVDAGELAAKPRAVILQMLSHLGVGQERFDWNLAEQVLAAASETAKPEHEAARLVHEAASALRTPRG